MAIAANHSHKKFYHRCSTAFWLRPCDLLSDVNDLTGDQRDEINTNQRRLQNLVKHVRWNYFGKIVNDF